MTERFERTQKILSMYIREEECLEPERIAGVDVAYGKSAYAACVICNRELEVVEEKSTVSKIYYPYVSTFFSFREFPPIARVLSGTEFDLLFVNGHGKAHPRSFGLACHVGLHAKKPTIGVASKIICGKIVDGRVMHNGKEVGAIFGKKIVSVGNLITLGQALHYTSLFSKDFFPHPLRLAHLLSERFKNLKTE